MILALLGHILVSSVLGYWLSFANGALAPWIAIVSLLAGTGFGVWIYLKRSEFSSGLRISDWRKGDLGLIETAVFVGILWVAVRQFLYLFYRLDGEWHTLDLSNFGDLPMHIDYIRALANGVAFPPINPGFAAEPLRYPFGIDFYNSLWEVLGVVTSGHLFVVGVAGCFCAAVCLRRLGGWLCMVGFFFNGGMSGFQILNRPDLSQNGLAWKNFFLTLIIPQRGLLIALPVGTLIVSWFLDLRDTQKLPRPQAALLGLFWGSLAFFHLHTFFLLSVLWAFYFVVYPSVRRQLLLSLGVAVPLSTWFVLVGTGFFKMGSVAHLKWGWLQEGDGFLPFMNWNLGFAFYLLIGFLFAILFYKPLSKYRIEVLFYFAVFAVFYNLMLAPWDWDNIKILIWPFTALLALLYRSSGSRIPIPYHMAFAVLLSLTAVRTLAPTMLSAIEAPVLIHQDDISGAKDLTKDFGPDAVFAAAPVHDHPLNYLGRNRAIGYEGHLWSHGINGAEAIAQLKELMRSATGLKELCQKLHATHVFWGRNERIYFRQSRFAGEQVLPKVASLADDAIYDCR